MSTFPSEEEMEKAPVELEVSLRLRGEMVRCKGYIPEDDWTTLGDHDSRFHELKMSMAKAMGAVLTQVEDCKMLQNDDSCPDPVQTPE